MTRSAKGIGVVMEPGERIVGQFVCFSSVESRSGSVDRLRLLNENGYIETLVVTPGLRDIRTAIELTQRNHQGKRVRVDLACLNDTFAWLYPEDDPRNNAGNRLRLRNYSWTVDTFPDGDELPVVRSHAPSLFEREAGE